ncbi:MAG: FimV/HubP family polar landmark protein, partial [Paraburkholderia sp.]|uniref:FimV/HubP family polar landmark protein n=1 Tax=Paraburkholderia sp. TaxID=1926495 RepID=UPI003C37116C
ATGQAGAAPSAASGSAATNAGVANGNPATDTGLDLSSTNLGIAAAIGAALVALLAGWGMRRRKRAAGAAEAADAAVSARAAAVVTAVPSEDGEDRGVEAFTGDIAAFDEPAQRRVAGGEAVQAGVMAREANAQEVAQESAAREAGELEATGHAAEQHASTREVTAHEGAVREVEGHDLMAHDVAAHEAAAYEEPVHEAAAQEAAAHEAAAQDVAAQDVAAQEPAAPEAAAQEAAAREAASHEAVANEATAQDAAPQQLPADHASVSDGSTSQSPASASQEPTAYDPDAFPVNRPVEQSASEPAPVGFEPAAFEHKRANGTPEQASQDLAKASEQASEIPLESVLDHDTKVGATSAVPQEPFTSTAESSDSDKQAEIPTGKQAADTASEATAPNEPASGYDPLHPPIHVDAADAEHRIEPNHGQAPVGSVTAPVESPALSGEDTIAAAGSHTNGAAGHWGTPEAFPLPEPLEPFPAELGAPKGFPREAVDAFGSLDLGLPPRLDSAALEPRPVSLDRHPVVDPEIAAQQALASRPSAPPKAADEIAAGTAGAGAVAGLGAARFGALNLDFDLELPPSPALPLPLFSPEDLGKIARNKLDLASEYIELGDLAGARSLIHEVIEANDATTRSEARAMLSTLAPLS